MTHLRIEQNNGVIEEVSSSVITKLYEIAHAGLDVSSNLLGRLHVTKAYGNEIDWLMLTYTDLYITADARYIKFADPVMQNLMPSYYGDGIGVTLQDMQSVTRITGAKFEGESITSFDELGLFTSTVSIGYRAFKDCTNLTSIDLSNITNLDTAALRNCTSLTGTIYLPNLTTFADGDGGAFQGCTGITSVVIGGNTPTLTNATLKKIFSECTALTSVTGLSDLTSIPQSCFDGCTSLTTVDLDWTKLTKIDHYAFLGCSALPIPALNCTLLTSLGLSAFRGCAGLQTVTSLGTITSISSETFRECSNLTSIDLSNITYIDKRGFAWCSKLTSVDLSSITDLGYEAFSGCTLLSSLNRTIFSGITRLHAGVFSDCPALTGELSFPDVTELIFESGIRGAQFLGCVNLTKISLGHLAALTHGYALNAAAPFKNCTNLKIVDLGDSLTSISDYNFEGCSSLKAIKLNVTTPPSKSNGANSTELRTIFGNSNVDIYVPDAAVSTYLATSPYSNFADHIKPLSTYNELSILAS